MSNQYIDLFIHVFGVIFFGILFVYTSFIVFTVYFNIFGLVVSLASFFYVYMMIIEIHNIKYQISLIKLIKRKENKDNIK